VFHAYFTVFHTNFTIHVYIIVFHGADMTFFTTGVICGFNAMLTVEPRAN